MQTIVNLLTRLTERSDPVATRARTRSGPLHFASLDEARSWVTGRGFTDRVQIRRHLDSLETWQSTDRLTPEGAQLLRKALEERLGNTGRLDINSVDEAREYLDKYYPTLTHLNAMADTVLADYAHLDATRESLAHLTFERFDRRRRAGLEVYVPPAEDWEAEYRRRGGHLQPVVNAQGVSYALGGLFTIGPSVWTPPLPASPEVEPEPLPPYTELPPYTALPSSAVDLQSASQPPRRRPSYPQGDQTP